MMTAVCPVFSTVTRNFTRNCVPPCGALKEADLKKFVEFLSKFSKLLVVTGAGISTESGIPDYRSEGVGAYARNKNFVPVQYQAFVKSSSFRQSYWLKNYLGWDNLYSLKPNRAHLTLTNLEQDNKLLHVITQNVDGLHYKANTKRVIELHGTAYRVICLSCPFQIERKAFQDMLTSSNPIVTVKQFQLNPDGFVDIAEEDVKSFSVPNCPDCGGVLKPDIVFFGDNVPKNRVQAVNDLVEECDALAVFGSSLAVQSSFRIVTRAHKLEKPIVAVNIGRTRADDIIDYKIEAKCGDVLSTAYDILRQDKTRMIRAD